MAGTFLSLSPAAATSCGEHAVVARAWENLPGTQPRQILDARLEAEAGANTIRTTRIVAIARVAVRVHTKEARGVVRNRRTLPPAGRLF